LKVEDIVCSTGKACGGCLAAHRLYLTSRVDIKKGVFCNQLKTVFGRIFPNNIETESGVKINAIFGAKSVADRIVSSPDLIGTTTSLMLLANKKIVKAYKGK
jgi:hypothetical protein